jgi:hypothetical protein
MPPRLLLVALASVGFVVLPRASVAAPNGSALASPVIFHYTGGEQTFVVPAGVTRIEVTAFGAAGGAATANAGDVPGSGAAEVYGAELRVLPGETLYVEVGGRGRNGNAVPCPGIADCKEAPGGFNGGGASVAIGGGNSGGGGGGASDVQRQSIRDGREAIFTRLVVAAGGGGTGGEGSVGGPAVGGHGARPGNDGGGGLSKYATNGELGGEGGGGGTSRAGGHGGLPGGRSYANHAVYFHGIAGDDGKLGDGGTGAGVALLRRCQGCPVAEGSGAGGGGGGGYFGGGGGGSGGIYECASSVYRCDPSTSPDAGGGGGGGGGSSFTPNGSIRNGPASQTSIFDGNGAVQISW